MNGNLIGSILGLTLTTAVVTGGVVGITKFQENKSVASENSEAIVLETDKVADETLSAENENELLSLEKLDEENSSEIEETDLEETNLEEEETVVEETTEEEKEEEADKKEETKPSEKKEEAKAETTTETVETTAETTTETPSEQPSETVEQPAQTTTTEAVTETPAEQTPVVETPPVTEFRVPLAPIADDGSDSARMYNEMVASTSMEEYMQKADALANASFDINGNLVDPSMIVVEPEPSTTTEVIEEVEVTE